MKRLPILLALMIAANINVICAQKNSTAADSIKTIKNNPLEKYSVKYRQQRFMNCNTADASNYFTDKEKEVIWILNMIRLDPKLFMDSVLLNKKNPSYMRPGYRDGNYASLMKDLNQLKPSKTLLMPDSSAYQSAMCHAITSGKDGYVGHERRGSCKKDFYGECCHYGYDDPLQILLSLLIDRGVPSLGHRYICLSPSYDKIGVSIQPHNNYGINCVLDFK